MSAYIPRRGDFVAVSFDPQSGHEQQGRRPALVISKDEFNARTGMCIVCPITNTRRDFPFHLPIPNDLGIEGCVMVEQVKSIDYRSRAIRQIGPAPTALLSEALSLLDACLY